VFFYKESSSSDTGLLQEVKPVHTWDDRCPRITWRADGQYFSIGSVNPNTGM